MFDLSYTWVSINCPNCNYQTDIQLIDVKTEIVIFCHNCKKSIQLKDESATVHTGVEIINKGILDLKKVFKKFGK